MSHLTVLGLGSNRGDSQNIILGAITELKKHLKGLCCASLYESEPLYVMEQPCFLNTAVSGLFSGSPKELLEIIHIIEASFGRDRSKEIRHGERSLDIDILIFGNIVYSSADLIIPHPGLKERRFALEPLLELLPNAVCPQTGETYQSICDSLLDQGVNKRLFTSKD